ncbi:flavin reductase family protein [Nonlabens marinus]|uniref:Conserved domain associated with flavoprotein oxygenases, DIM6/NTAB family n=1 Tax=Nonlabens marinus S1-08 TaxID=1454201 RepID=W8VVR8_9FLAO|nr:flavin reductase [Nonlabens marinus]BAO55678.1 conserved domain associated with flavoprotein oxygenases, DIM6/NTAB family [Nonlabens marinus S1-08]
MTHYTTTDLNQMNRFYRGNLINSVTGFKSANLLATQSENGIDNVAIFSSVTHLGSDPALFSFIQRPLGHGVGHTYENLKQTGELTLNHVIAPLVDPAHQSSAKYDASTSEFEKLGIEKLSRTGIKAPFVKEAVIQVAAQYESEYYIKENKCIMVLCRITDIYLKEGIQLEDGWLNLEKAGSLAINGLDGYAACNIEKRLSYAKVDEELKALEF